MTLRTLHIGMALVLNALPIGLAVAQASASEPLALAAGDLIVQPQGDGIHLFVRQRPGVASVMLTEAFELPDHKLATYALRSIGANPVNDNEKRILDGKSLKQPHHSLLSSKVVDGPSGWKAFEILITSELEYGSTANPNSRYGHIDVKAALASMGPPLWFSVRTFSKPFGDYSGEKKDNAFELKALLVQRFVPSDDRYEKGLAEGFGRLGKAYRASDIQDALGEIKKALERPADSLDMVVAIDTTKSMTQNLQAVKENLLTVIEKESAKFKKFRLGLVFYRDYMEDYVTRSVAFSSDFAQIQKDLNSAQADGGGDIPEAVVEALGAGIDNFHWTADSRVLILLGDAPQHPAPRGGLSEAQVRQGAAEKKIELQLIMLPQTAF